MLGGVLIQPGGSSGHRLWGISVMVINRCDLEGEGEEGVTLEALEKASKELGFEDFLRYTHNVMHWLRSYIILMFLNVQVKHNCFT